MLFTGLIKAARTACQLTAARHMKTLDTSATPNTARLRWKYANLVKDLQVHRPEQLWVSDITYIRMNNRWGYLSLITDAYSHRIMGHCFHKELTAQGCIQALAMALDQRIYRDELIHHSDRGSQYCSKGYIQPLMENKIAISMTENGDPYENALAERVNGILKEEFNLHHSGMGFEDTGRRIAESIKAYNQLRPHASCDYLTPEQAHLRAGTLVKRWKNKKIKKQEPNLNLPARRAPEGGKKENGSENKKNDSFYT